MSKFGALVERLVGAQAYFVPDGADFSLNETPDLCSVTNKPANTEWNAFDLGGVQMARYTPKTKDRVREWFNGRRYVERTDKVVVQDAFELTLKDTAAKLYDQLMFGMAAEPADGVAQQAFQTATRHKDGWLRLVRTNEDETNLCECEIFVRLTITTFPDDKNEPGGPVLRVEHLSTGGVLDTIEFNY